MTALALLGGLLAGWVAGVLTVVVVLTWTTDDEVDDG